MSLPVRHERGVLDTGTLILLPQIDDPELLPVEPLITAVTLAELSVGPLIAATEEERVARQAADSSLLARFRGIHRSSREVSL